MNEGHRSERVGKGFEGRRRSSVNQMGEGDAVETGISMYKKNVVFMQSIAIL